MSKRPITIVQRKVVRKPAERPPSETAFSFDFDDDGVETPLTGSAKINSVLEQTSTTDFSIGAAQIKLREGPSKSQSVQSSAPETSLHQLSNCLPNKNTMTDNANENNHNNNNNNNKLNTTITLYSPETLLIPPILHPTHVTPRTTPGTHIIYATSIPQQPQQVKKRPVVPKGKAKKLPQTTTTAPTTKSPTSPLATPSPITQSFIPLPEAYLPLNGNHIPKWIMGLDPLSPDDFDCPLSSLPDLMIEPDDYLLSLPNPTNRSRNIFISISAPLRCVTANGTLLESAIGLRKFRKYEDRYLISNTTGKPIRDHMNPPSICVNEGVDGSCMNEEKVMTKQSQQQQQQQTKGTTNSKNPGKNSGKEQDLGPMWTEEHLLIPFPNPHQQYGIPEECNNDTTHNVKKDIELNSIVNETTTFAIVIPPMSVLDLCHIVTTAHTHQCNTDINGVNMPLSSFIHTEDYSGMDSDDFITKMQQNGDENGDDEKKCENKSKKVFNPYNYPPAQTPLNCPDWLKTVCKRDMPLDLAQRYISNHIASNNVTADSTGGRQNDKNTTTTTPPNTQKLPNFIPILQSPLPSNAPYLISQSFCGLLTHHSPQTRYAVDLVCVNGTPVYSPIDGIVIDFQNKACSIGNHVTNLFDWNSITLRGNCNDIIVAFPGQTKNEGDIANENPANQHTICIPDIKSSSTSLITSHNLTETDLTALQNPIYIDLVHLSTVVVKKHQNVKKGELIGYTGSTGFAPLPHLHLQVSLSQQNNAMTIPFGFAINRDNTNDGKTSLPKAVFPQAGYALTYTGLITLEDYNNIISIAHDKHCEANGIISKPNKNTQTNDTKTNTVAPIKAGLSKGKLVVANNNKKQLAQPQSCCNLDQHSILKILLTNHGKSLPIPFHQSLQQTFASTTDQRKKD